MPEKTTFFWEIVPGTQCNLRCANCYAANGGRPDCRALSLAEAQSALQKAIELGANTISILGGEPLMCRYLPAFVAYFKQHARSGFCGVVSNGTLLTPDLAKSLRDAGLDQISISVDGSMPATNDAHRGVGSFERILNGIAAAVDAKLRVTVGYTVTQFNLDDTGIFQLSRRLGASAVSIQIADPVGRGRQSLRGSRCFSRIQALKSICQLYQRERPPLYTEISSRWLFQGLLNKFFNAGLQINAGVCEGGHNTFMVTSGGDIFPCSIYAYTPDGQERARGVNLVTHELPAIREHINHTYSAFNKSTLKVAEESFQDCRLCDHKAVCIPCPMQNKPGKIGECEWVRTQEKRLTDVMLRSTVRLLRQPTVVEESRIGFQVQTQSEPLYVPLDGDEFQQLTQCASVSDIVKMYAADGAAYHQAEDVAIRFIGALRSHGIVELEGLKSYLEQDLKPAATTEISLPEAQTPL